MTDMETIHVFWQVGTRSIGGMLNAMNQAVLNMSYVKLKGIEYKIGAIHKRRRNIIGGRGSEIPLLKEIRR